MAVTLNHTIVNARDKRVSADFLTSLFGLPPAKAWGPFLAVETANDVGLDFYDTEDDFDQIFGRIQAQGIPYWADPGHSQSGTHNTHDGGRGLYFDDPSGHNLEIITRPYGDER